MERIMKEGDNPTQLQAERGGNQFQMAQTVGNQATIQRYREVTQLELTPLEQNGPNCGIFAMAMAIQDFIDGEGMTIAEGLQNIATSIGVSILGEMFQADHLAEVGSRFCKENGLKLTCASVSFQNQEQLGFLLGKNKEKEIRILFPYASLDAIPQTGSEGIGKIEVADAIKNDFSVSGDVSSLRPRNMSHAHWSVINEMKNPDDIQIYEGNGVMEKEKTSLGVLFESNKILGNAFSWKAFLESQEKYWNELKSYIGNAEFDQEKVDEQIKLIEKRIEVVKIQIGTKPVIDVDLKGKVVIVGLQAAVDSMVKGMTTGL